MSQQYRIEAQARAGRERFLIITDSRDRALYFAGLFRANPDYEAVSVQVGAKLWLGSRIGEIP